MKCKNPRREYIIEFNDVPQAVAKSESENTNCPVAEEIIGGHLIKGRIPNGTEYETSTGSKKSIGSSSVQAMLSRPVPVVKICTWSNGELPTTALSANPTRCNS